MTGWYDLHTHTRFSDGSTMAEMVKAAEIAGCDGIGLSDHCILVDDEFGRREQYDLVETYDHRRARIEDLREDASVRILDGAEMSHVPGEAERTAAFLETAAFEYTIGSVHFAGGYDFTSATTLASVSRDERRNALDAYYDAVVSAVECGLYDVLGHIDLPDRLDCLRGLSEKRDYERVAEALANSPTVPELNAGRLHRSLGRIHPNPAFLECFIERDVGFVLGSDAHTPDELTRRTPSLAAILESYPALEIIPIESVGIVPVEQRINP